MFVLPNYISNVGQFGIIRFTQYFARHQMQ